MVHDKKVLTGWYDSVKVRARSSENLGQNLEVLDTQRAAGSK
jgi:hypothetical protein